MKLLKLGPAVIAHIEVTRTPLSERALRTLFAATPDQQLRFVHARQPIASRDD